MYLYKSYIPFGNLYFVSSEINRRPTCLSCFFLKKKSNQIEQTCDKIWRKFTLNFYQRRLAIMFFSYILIARDGIKAMGVIFFIVCQMQANSVSIRPTKMEDFCYFLFLFFIRFPCFKGDQIKVALLKSTL